MLSLALSTSSANKASGSIEPEHAFVHSGRPGTSIKFDWSKQQSTMRWEPAEAPVAMNAEIERSAVATAISWEFRFSPLPVTGEVAMHDKSADSLAAAAQAVVLWMPTRPHEHTAKRTWLIVIGKRIGHGKSNVEVGISTKNC